MKEEEVEDIEIGTNVKIMSSWLKPFLSGAIGGACSTFLLQPLDLLKTRIQTTPKNKPLKVQQVFRNVVENEGATTLWRGLTPTLIRVVPGIGLYFFTLEVLQKTTGIQNPTSSQNLLLGFTARSFVVTFLLPVTVLKTRFESNYYKNYASLKVGFQQIMHKNGLKGFFSGLTPTLMRDAPFSALYLMFYRYQQTLLGEELLQGRWSSALYLCCGINAGITACLITHPFDMIKTQMQLFPQEYPTTFKSATIIYQSQGLQGFFRGIVFRACRRTLMSALSWTVYEKLSQSVRS